jgi:hypothetical protein
VKPHVVLFATLLLVAAAAASPDIDSLANHAPGLETYPQASAILLFDSKTVTLDADGRTFTEHEFAWKILDERAKDQYGDQSVRYDSEQDTVIIEAARTRLPDGKWIDPEPDALTITSAPEVQFASAYSSLKQRNVSFPGLEVGAVIYLHYRIEPKPGAKVPKDREAGGITLFGGYNPILQKSLTIVFPPAWKIQYQLQNSDRVPEISRPGAQLIYKWEFHNVDQIIDEPNSVGLSELVPRLLWTTFAGWEDLDIYVLRRFLERADTAQAAIEGFRAITPGTLTGIPAVMNAALWVQQNIRNVHLSLGAVGYDPNTADRVWQNKYGDPRDKAVLLNAILLSYGFESIPVLVTNSPVQFCDLPVLEQFNHIILAVPMDQDTLWFDPTAEYYPPGQLPYRCTYGQGCMLVNGAPLLTRIPAGPVDSRTTSTTMLLSLSSNGTLTGDVTCQPHGQFAARARNIFKDQKEQERDIYVQRAAARFGQGTTSTSFHASDPADVTNRFTVSMGIESPGYAVKQDDLMLVELPSSPFDFGLIGFYPSLPQVKYPVGLPWQGASRLDVNVSLPEGYSVSYVAAPLIVDNQYIHLELHAKAGAGSIIWTQMAEIKADRIPVKDYQTVREAYETFVLPKNRLAILEQNKED